MKASIGEIPDPAAMVALHKDLGDLLKHMRGTDAAAPAFAGVAARA